ncbi:hypothetical protein XENOCAPTIV_014405, partial [Xenoophorus captivus]
GIHGISKAFNQVLNHANHQEADLKVWQKDEELKKTTARLMEMTEKYNKQQNVVGSFSSFRLGIKNVPYIREEADTT